MTSLHRFDRSDATEHVRAETARFGLRFWRQDATMVGRALAFALAISTTLLMSGTVPVSAGDPEYGVDRPGSDYQPPIDLEPKVGSFLTYEMECAGLCTKDERCMSWTMVKPGVQGPKARCYLKNSVPTAKNNSCCSSGVADRAAPQTLATGEPESGIDRPGSDYQPPIELEFKQGSFLTFENECKGLCMNDQRCKAWTMVKPGIQGPKARCYLKNAVPAAQVNSCCSSGVAVRTASTPSPQLDPVEAADNDPTGKTMEQCAAAKQRNEGRCISRFGPINMGSCMTVAAQIYGACVNVAAQAAQSQTPQAPTTPASAVPADWADMLAAHNELRREHCVAPLTWSPSLAASAQAYASTCNLYQHGSTGENMSNAYAYQTVGNTSTDVLPAKSDRAAFTETWACEAQYYSYSNPKICGGFKGQCNEPKPECGGSPVTGHFTQVVWKDTTQVGCGRATCTIDGHQGTNWVCRYSVAGNNSSDPNVLRQQVLDPATCK